MYIVLENSVFSKFRHFHVTAFNIFSYWPSAVLVLIFFFFGKQLADIFFKYINYEGYIGFLRGYAGPYSVRRYSLLSFVLFVLYRSQELNPNPTDFYNFTTIFPGFGKEHIWSVRILYVPVPSQKPVFFVFICLTFFFSIDKVNFRLLWKVSLYLFWGLFMTNV